MAEEATQTATLMVRVMNNIDVALIGAAAGAVGHMVMGRNKNNQPF